MAIWRPRSEAVNLPQPIERSWDPCQPPEIGALASAGAAQIDLLVASLAHSGELWVGGAALSNRDPARLRPQLGSPRSVPEVGPPATGAPERAGVWGQDPTGVPSSLEGARRRGSCALYHDCNRDVIALPSQLGMRRGVLLQTFSCIILTFLSRGLWHPILTFNQDLYLW